MIELKKVSSLYGIYAGGSLLKQAATWQALDKEARDLARANRDLYRRVEPVTPHDTNTIDPTTSVRVTVAGDVAVTFFGDSGDTAVVVSSVPANGVGLVGRVNRVRSTNTTATGIEAVYEEQF